MFNNKGLGAELLCQYELIKRDFGVSIPVNPNSRYDIIADNGYDLIRVQVKARMKARKRRENDKYRYEIELRGTAENRRQYNENEVHFFAIMTSDENIWYIIPAKFVESKKTISLYPFEENRKYSEFKNAWHLLRDPATLDMSLSNCRDKPL